MYTLEVEKVGNGRIQVRQGKRFYEEFFRLQRLAGAKAYLNGREFRRGSRTFAWACGSPRYCENCGTMHRQTRTVCQCGEHTLPTGSLNEIEAEG